MANFTEKDALTLFNRTAPDDRPLCKTCKKPFDKNARNQKYCKACIPYNTTPAVGRWDKPPKRKRRKRDSATAARNKLTPDDSGPSSLTACPTCGVTWKDAIRRGHTVAGGITYDNFTCNCKPKGHKFDRYKVE